MAKKVRPKTIKNPPADQRGISYLGVGDESALTLKDAIKGDSNAIRGMLVLAAHSLWIGGRLDEPLRRFIAQALARIAADEKPATVFGGADSFIEDEKQFIALLQTGWTSIRSLKPMRHLTFPASAKGGAWSRSPAYERLIVAAYLNSLENCSQVKTAELETAAQFKISVRTVQRYVLLHKHLFRNPT